MADPAETEVAGEALGALEVIARRRSVGVVESTPVARELIERLIGAAAAAPNHKNTEPWRFVILEGAARRRVGLAHAKAAVSAGGSTDEEREAAKLERAPVVIACICASDRSDRLRSTEDRDAVAAAVQNMLLAAEALGLAAIWRTGTMPDEPEVRAELGVGDEAELVAFVYVGWPRAGQRPSPPTRRPLSEIVEWRSS